MNAIKSLNLCQEPPLPLDLNLPTLREKRHVTHLIVGKSKQLLPQTISILNGPFLSQELDNLIMSFQEGISVPPNGVGGVTILDN